MEAINKSHEIPSSTQYRKLFDTILQTMKLSPTLGDPYAWPQLAALYRRISDFLDRERGIGSRPYVEVYTERELTSQDRLLSGRIDAYFVSANGAIEVVDYKSGALGQGAPREEYADQLLFYAFLIEETHGIYPSSLTLIGSDGTTASIALDRGRSIELANASRAMLANYNAAVRNQSAQEMAVPTKENCQFCDVKASCERFWAALPKLETPDWNHVAIGVQKSPLQFAARGVGCFDFRVEKSSLMNAREFKVTRVLPAQFPHIDFVKGEGQKLFLSALRFARGKENAIVEITDRTTINRFD